MLKRIYSGISQDDIREFSDRWFIEDNVFRCTYGLRCIMHVYIQEERMFLVSYRIEKKEENGGYTTIYENEAVVWPRKNSPVLCTGGFYLY